MRKVNTDLYEEPKVSYNYAPSFADYILHSQANIIKTRLDLHGPEAVSIIKANSPFALPAKGRRGTLLIHGLLDNPFNLHDIGLHLQAHDIPSKAILLPGHGLTPGALLRVTYEDWLQALEYGIQQLAKEVDEIVLIGFSTGASLILHHALSNPHPKVQGYILLSPAIQILSAWAFASNWHPLLSWKWKRALWLQMADEVDYCRYQSICFNAVYQVYRLTQQLKRLAKKIDLPCLIAISEDDKVISYPASKAFFESYMSPASQFILYTNKTHSETRFTCRPATFTPWHIKKISHVSIPIAPQNSHYGMHGDYLYGSHVEENAKSKNPISYDSDYILQHNFINTNKKRSQHQRLTFNPDFDFLAKAIMTFIQK